MVSSQPPDYDWFIEQVRQEQAGLRVFIRSLGLRAESADDVAQEAFVVAFGKLHAFERGTNFGAWVRTIARFLVSKELRREDRRQRFMAEHIADFLITSADAQPADGRDKREALRHCLAEMPARSRQLVQQRYFENLSPAVIASQEGRTAGDVRQALFRLRNVLHACINRRLVESTL